MKKKHRNREYLSLIKRSRERKLMPSPKEFRNRKSYCRRDSKKELRMERENDG